MAIEATRVVPRFRRIDIAEAHYVYARLHAVGADTRRRDLARLRRLRFKPGLACRAFGRYRASLALSTNGYLIYLELLAREGN